MFFGREVKEILKFWGILNEDFLLLECRKELEDKVII